MPDTPVSDVSTEAQPTVDAPRPGRFRRIWSRLPYWAMALLLILPSVALRCFHLDDRAAAIAQSIAVTAAIFLTGAVKRFNWRHVLVMLGVCVAVLGGTYAFERLGGRRWISYCRLGWWLFQMLVQASAIGLAEGALRRRLNRKSLLPILLASAGAAAAALLVRRLLTLRYGYVAIPSIGGGEKWVSPLGMWEIDALCIWVLIPPSIRAGAIRSACRRVATAAALAAPVLLYVLFHGWLVYPLMARSMRGDGPFDRHQAPRWLVIRGREADYQLMWEQLQGDPWEPHRIEPIWKDDWRRATIHMLARHDPAGTAERLSRLLRTRPRPTLAERAADLFVEQDRYEAVPIMMRYALSERRYMSGDACQQALERMRLPQAALLALIDAMAYDKPRGQAGNFDVSPANREKLKHLLREDAGADYDSWVRLYDSTIADQPTPLPDEIRDETDRVFECWVAYHNVRHEWREARGALMRRMLVAEGGQEQLDALYRLNAKARKIREPWAYQPTVEEELFTGKLERICEQAEQTLSVAGPDWNVPTTEGLEREIDAYAARVDAMIERVIPSSTTAPASRPATQPQ